MSRTSTLHPNPSSPVLFLRNARGLSQKKVAEAVGLTPMKLSHIERGRWGMSVESVKKVADYFGITVHALVHNDYAAILPNMGPMPPRHSNMVKAFQRKAAATSEVGDAGEAFVAARERQRLRGTGYENGVNESYANDQTAGFDIHSFTWDGKPNYIEVKATVGDLDEPFTMTAREKEFMESCLAKGLHYELHRVYHLKDSEHAEVKVYTAQEVMEFFFEVSAYTVRSAAA